MIQTLATDGSAKVVADASALAPAFQRPLNAMRQELQKPIDQFARMEQRFNELADAWTSVGKNIESLTAPRTLEQVDNGQAQVNLTSFLARADQRVTEMKQLLTTVRAAMDQMKTTAAKLDTTATAVTGVTENAGQHFKQLMKRYIATADDLSALIFDTRKLVQNASEGQGSLGKLINDPSLYEDLDDSAQRIGKAMDEIRLMIDKWNTEGVPLQF
jgi:DNA repair ATPase RecN